MKAAICICGASSAPRCLVPPKYGAITPDIRPRNVADVKVGKPDQPQVSQGADDQREATYPGNDAQPTVGEANFHLTTQQHGAQRADHEQELPGERVEEPALPVQPIVMSMDGSRLTHIHIAHEASNAIIGLIAIKP